LELEGKFIATSEQEMCYFDFTNPFTPVMNFNTKIFGQKNSVPLHNTLQWKV
jgi:hypothetical protein